MIVTLSLQIAMLPVIIFPMLFLLKKSRQPHSYSDKKTTAENDGNTAAH
jgi:hypothetical protein